MMEFLETNWTIFGAFALVSLAMVICNFIHTWRIGEYPSGKVIAVHLIGSAMAFVLGVCFSIGAIIHIVRWVNAHP